MREYVDNTATYKPEAIKALREFKALKTWKPEAIADERFAGLQALVDKLTEVYRMPPLKIFTDLLEAVAYDTAGGYPIMVTENLSTITILHNFAGVRHRVHQIPLGKSFNSRQRWAVNLFRKVYPRQFARLTLDAGNGFFYNVQAPVEQVAAVA